MAYSCVAAEAGSAGYGVSSDGHSFVENELNGGCCLNGALEQIFHAHGMRSSASFFNIMYFIFLVKTWLGNISNM
jgi:hypothetical protein